MPLNEEIYRHDIPFLVPDLPSCHEIVPFLQSIDANRWYSNFGPLQHQFEQLLAQSFFPQLDPKDERVVVCSSGTTAIELALLGLNLPKNARILVPSFTFAASATAIIRAGYIPVFTDVDPESWLLTPKIAKDVLNYLSVDAVLTVASLGLAQDAQAWSEFNQKTNIPVIIDAAAALGSQEIADNLIVCFSLHATKSFGVGEGGLLIAPDEGFAKRVRELSNFGFVNGEIPKAGSNYKFSEYHAAVGLAQLKRLPLLKRRREKVRMAYQNAIKVLDGQVYLQKSSVATGDVVPINEQGFSSAAAMVLADDVAEFCCAIMEKLGAQGIGTRKWYSPALHHHVGFEQYTRINPQGTDHLPTTEWLEKGMIGIPFHNFLTTPEIVYICQCISENVTNIRASRLQSKSL